MEKYAILSMNAITVTFTQLTGFERRPIGRTCGNMLELPSTYESFVDLRHEFSEILQSGVWVMDVMQIFNVSLGEKNPQDNTSNSFRMFVQC